MRRTLGSFVVFAVASLILVAAAVQAQDKAEKIQPDKLPKAIKDAIDGRFPGATITSAEKEKDADKVVFDIELKHQGRKYEMDILENGTVIEVEKEVALKDAPAALAKTIEAKFPKATIKDIMEVNKVKDKKETPEHFEVTIEVDGKQQEVLVTLDGKSIKKEEK